MADEETLDLYVVQWPERGIIKVGISGNGRWRNFGGGVQLVATFRARRDLTRAIEKEAHERLSARCVRPFRYGHMAKALLGKNGEGHSECYLDDGTVLTEVIGIATDLAGADGGHLAVQRAVDSTPLFVAVEPEPDRYDEGFAEGYKAGERFEKWWPSGDERNGCCGHCDGCIADKDCEVGAELEQFEKCPACGRPGCLLWAIYTAGCGTGGQQGFQAGAKKGWEEGWAKGAEATSEMYQGMWPQYLDWKLSLVVDYEGLVWRAERKMAEQAAQGDA